MSEHSSSGVAEWISPKNVSVSRPLPLRPIGRKQREQLELLTKDLPSTILAFDAVSDFVVDRQGESHVLKHVVQQLVDVGSRESEHLGATFEGDVVVEVATHLDVRSSAIFRIAESR